MVQLLIRGLEPEIVERLKCRAKRNHRSLEAEARFILSVAEPDQAAYERAVRFADEMRLLTAAKVGPDSAGLIREDRDR